MLGLSVQSLGGYSLFIQGLLTMNSHVQKRTIIKVGNIFWMQAWPVCIPCLSLKSLGGSPFKYRVLAMNSTCSCEDQILKPGVYFGSLLGLPVQYPGGYSLFIQGFLTMTSHVQKRATIKVGSIFWRHTWSICILCLCVQSLGGSPFKYRVLAMISTCLAKTKY